MERVNPATVTNSRLAALAGAMAQHQASSAFDSSEADLFNEFSNLLGEIAYQFSNHSEGPEVNELAEFVASAQVPVQKISERAHPETEKHSADSEAKEPSQANYERSSSAEQNVESQGKIQSQEVVQSNKKSENEAPVAQEKLATPAKNEESQSSQAPVDKQKIQEVKTSDAPELDSQVVQKMQTEAAQEQVETTKDKLPQLVTNTPEVNVAQTVQVKALPQNSNAAATPTVQKAPTKSEQVVDSQINPQVTNQASDQSEAAMLARAAQKIISPENGEHTQGVEGAQTNTQSSQAIVSSQPTFNTSLGQLFSKSVLSALNDIPRANVVTENNAAKVGEARVAEARITTPSVDLSQVRDAAALKNQDVSSRTETTRTPKGATRSSLLQNMDKIESALKDAARGRNGNTISLRLDPPELGKVKVDVSLREGKLHARIVCDSSQVSSFLRDKAYDLQSTLRRLGLDVDQITVSVQSDQSGADLFNGFTGLGSDAQGRSAARNEFENDKSAQRGGSSGELGSSETLDHWVA